MHRSHWGFWLALAGAVVTYLLASPPPTDWSYQDWLKAAAFGIAWGVGKLQSSPLPGKEEV